MENSRIQQLIQEMVSAREQQWAIEENRPYHQAVRDIHTLLQARECEVPRPVIYKIIDDRLAQGGLFVGIPKESIAHQLEGEYCPMEKEFSLKDYLDYMHWSFVAILGMAQQY